MEPLALKDIHLPEPISWWPPAPGWWLPPLLIAAAVAVYYLVRRVTRKTVLKTARKMLESLRRQPGGDPRSTVAQLSAWLRRVAISRGRRETVAGLHGEAWLAYLDRGLPDAPFSQGIGRCFADAHYRPAARDIDVEGLFALCERWLKQQGKRPC